MPIRRKFIKLWLIKHVRKDKRVPLKIYWQVWYIHILRSTHFKWLVLLGITISVKRVFLSEWKAHLAKILITSLAWLIMPMKTSCVVAARMTECITKNEIIVTIYRLFCLSSKRKTSLIYNNEGYVEIIRSDATGM